MTLGIGSLTNLVKEIREDVRKILSPLMKIQIVKSGRIFAQLLISTEGFCQSGSIHTARTQK